MNASPPPSPPRPARALPLAAALGLLLAGCDALSYTPSGEHPVDVSPMAAAPVIDLGTAPDTLGLWGTASLAYALDTGGRQLLRVEVYVGETRVASTPSPTAVSFETVPIPDGTYPLRVVAVVPSGTGSLADRHGRETVAAEVRRVAVVDNAPPAAPPQPELGLEEGTLRLRWRPYDRLNFQAYRIYRVAPDGGRALEAEITDPSAASWDHAGFLGGRAALSVAVLAAGRLAESPPARVDYPTPSLVEAEALGEGRIALRWTPTPFHANLAAYRIVRSTLVFDPWEEATVEVGERVVHTLEDPAASTLTDEPPFVFGQRYRYRLEAVPKGPGGPLRSAPRETGVDPHAGLHYPIVFHAPTASFIGASRPGDRLLRVDAASFQVRASASPGATALSVSPDGAHLVSHTDGTLHTRDPHALGVRQSVALSPLLGPNPWVMDRDPEGYPWITEPVVTSDGLYGFSLGRISEWVYRPYDGAHVVDLGRGIRIGGVAGGLGAHLVAASERLTYLAVGRRGDPYVGIYVRDPSAADGYALAHHVLDLDDLGALHFLDDERYLVLTAEWEAVTRDARTGAELARRPQEVPHLPRIDRGTGVLYGFEDGGGHVVGYDLATGERVLEVRAVADLVRHPEPYVLSGGVLWYGGSYRRVLPLRP